MGKLTERGGFVKQDASEPADIAVYNDNMDRVHNDVMSVPFSNSDPAATNSWPGKLMLRDSGDPTFFLPDLRVNKANGEWERAISGSWEAYTPPTTSITVGNGTLLGRYCHVGSILYCEVLFILGSTSVVSGGAGFGTPTGYQWRVPPDFEDVMRSAVGHWTARCGAGPNLYKGRALRRVTGGTINIDMRTAETPALQLAGGRPDTWQTGNKLHVQAMGEVTWS